MWIVALTILAIGNPESDFHFTIFWPYYVWGIKSPGYGLGHSISYLFRGDIISSFQTHILGIPAVADHSVADRDAANEALQTE